MQFRKSLGFAFLFIAGCSKPANHNPLAVADPRGVGAILMASDVSSLETCERELRGAGAKVLYRNDAGVLFTDRQPAELSLSRCRATISANQPLSLAAPADRKADLSSLLKLLPAGEIGARSFVQAHPSYDGRGVKVAILDTGIELDHVMLKKTPNGEDKIIDFQDFSGEGNVGLSAVSLSTDGSFEAANAKYSATGILGTEFAFGVFLGSSLNNKAEENPADKYSDLGLLVYKGGDGKWKSRLDVEGDHKFENDVELENFVVSHRFVKIGSRKLLATAINVADDGKSATLAFDDGSHGTHVAGISLGYDPNGLQGVAPGAQVMSMKIGDNRLAGGSTTTASMMLAIDYAAAHGAHIVNMSYGIRGGSNLGTSTIDQYVDKIAREKGLIFAISAGNEGPGTLTVGVPAGASLALTAAAYLSKETARTNYGYLGVEDDRTWHFSSVGPLLNGGFKPTILAPGTAVASVPIWSGGYANYRGTSMAAPQTTGGLALLVSAALQEKLPVDRVSITQSVYASAKPVAGLALIEQGYGLINVPAAFAELQTRQGQLPVEYEIAVNSPTAPGGSGKGIYVRARRLPANPFTVRVTPRFPSGTPPAQTTALRQFTLQASAPWIRTPGTAWVAGAATTFQVQLDPAVLAKPGLYSERITAIDNATGKVAYVVPVTVMAPASLDDNAGHRFTASPTVRVGQTVRYFVDVPAGATALAVDLSTDGPAIWGQLLDPEGRKVLTLDDSQRTSPQNPLFGSAALKRGGVYELDVTAPVTNGKAAAVQVAMQAYSLAVSASAPASHGAFELTVQNNFEPVKLKSKTEVRGYLRSQVVGVAGNGQDVPFAVAESDRQGMKEIRFRVVTSKAFYDQMTDYPYLLLNPTGKVLSAGGLELDSEIVFAEISSHDAGNYTLRVQGAFTKQAPEHWAFTLEETRVMSSAFSTGDETKLALETGQFQTLKVTPVAELPGAPAGFSTCATVSLTSGDERRTIQETTLCP